jgi:S-adenosylmethionine synthetase
LPSGRSGTLPYLRPDGKSQVTVEYRNGKPARVDAIVISTQHSPEVSNERLARDIRASVINEVVPEGMLDAKTHFYINPSGRNVAQNRDHRRCSTLCPGSADEKGARHGPADEDRSTNRRVVSPHEQ